MSYTYDCLKVLEKAIPEIKLSNYSITTDSIYLKTPDGYSLRIGDHNGKQKYKYKWNLLEGSTTGWVKEDGKWRYYTSDVKSLIFQLKDSIEYKKRMDEAV